MILEIGLIYEQITTHQHVVITDIIDHHIVFTIDNHSQTMNEIFFERCFQRCVSTIDTED